jgi:hypothetical protein
VAVTQEDEHDGLKTSGRTVRQEEEEEEEQQQQQAAREERQGHRRRRRRLPGCGSSTFSSSLKDVADWNSKRSRRQRQIEDEAAAAMGAATTTGWIKEHTTTTTNSTCTTVTTNRSRASGVQQQSSWNRRGGAAGAPYYGIPPRPSTGNSPTISALSLITNRCDWRFPLWDGNSAAANISSSSSSNNNNNNNNSRTVLRNSNITHHIFHSAGARELHVRSHQQQRQRRLLVSSSSPPSGAEALLRLRPRLLHRNLHGTPYGPVTVLDPRDDVVAALDPAHQRIDLLRVSAGAGAGFGGGRDTGSSSSSSDSLIQHVSLSTQSGRGGTSSSLWGGGLSGRCYGLRSIYNGRGLAVGLPTGDFLVCSAETGQALVRASPMQQRHNIINNRRTSGSAQYCDLGGPYFTSQHHVIGPARRYRPSPKWTLWQQSGRTDDDDLVEIWGWNRRWAPPGTNDFNYCAEEETAVVVPSSKTRTNSSWDFCEATSLSSTSLVAAHVGEDYVGVRLSEDRVDRTHILVLGGGDGDDNNNNNSKTTTTTMRAFRDEPATGVAFCAGGRLLATGHATSQPANPMAFDDEINTDPVGVVMLWDLRMTKVPADAILPSFPREAAHRMLADDAVEAFGYDNLHRRGAALELPQLVNSDQQQGSLVCLSPLERAMLCHRLLPSVGTGRTAPLATALHDAGIRIDARHDALCFTNIEHHLAERRRRDDATTGPPLAGKPTKRAYSQTLERLFGGTLSPMSPRDPPRHPPADPRHRKKDDEHARHHHAVSIHLEDRYGCRTSVSSLCASQHPGGRVVAGTSDGDVYVFEPRPH